MYNTSLKTITYYFIAHIIFYTIIYYLSLHTERNKIPTNQLDLLKNTLHKYSCNNKQPNINLYIVPDSVNEYTLAIKILKEAWTSIDSTDLLNDSITTNLSTLNGSNSRSITCVNISIAYLSKNIAKDSKNPGLHGNYYIFLQKSNYIDEENNSKFLLEILDYGIHILFYGHKSDENMTAGIIWNIAQKSFFGSHTRFSGDGSMISNVMSALPFHSQYDFNFILSTDQNFRPSWDFNSQVLPLIRPTLDALSTISHINIHSQIIGSTGFLSCSEQSDNSIIIDVKNDCFYRKLDSLLPKGIMSKPLHFSPPEINFIAYINDFNLLFKDDNLYDKAISIRNWGFISTLTVHNPGKLYKLSDAQVKRLSGRWFSHLRISLGLPLHLLEYASISNIDNPNDIYLKKIQNITFRIKALECIAWDTFTNFEYNSIAVKALDEYINSTLSNLSYLISTSNLHFRLQIPQRIIIGFKESISLLKCSILTLNGDDCGDLTNYRNLLLQVRFITKDIDNEPRIYVSLGLARQAYEISKNLLSDDSLGLINYTYFQSVLVFILSAVFPFVSTQITTIIKLIKNRIKDYTSTL